MIKEILCFLPVVGDTKDAKRVDILQKAGYKVTVVAFEREYFISRLPDCKIITIGKIENGKYIRRILIMLVSLFKLRKIIKNFDAIYALSPDLAFMSYLSSIDLGKPIIIDVADIREIQVSNSFFGRITRILDRFITKRSKLLVVTSGAFISDYYNKILQLSVKNYYLLENKVDYDFSIINTTYKDKGKVRIGYFGVLRDNWAVELLLSLLKKYPRKYEILLSGINMISKFDICKLNDIQEGFSYSGPYRSPKDLQKIYKNIDLIALFYPEDSNDINWTKVRKICRTNRFYEACFFKKPLLAFSYSEDGRNIKKLNIGCTFSNNNLNEVIEKVNQDITHDQIIKWIKNMEKLPPNFYKFQNEASELKSIIDQITL